MPQGSLFVEFGASLPFSGDPDRPMTDIRVTWAELQAFTGKAKEELAPLYYQIDDDVFLGPDPNRPPIPDEIKELWVNHSCDGNSWYEVRQGA